MEIEKLINPPDVPLHGYQQAVTEPHCRQIKPLAAIKFKSLCFVGLFSRFLSYLSSPAITTKIRLSERIRSTALYGYELAIWVIQESIKRLVMIKIKPKNHLPTSQLFTYQNHLHGKPHQNRYLRKNINSTFRKILQYQRVQYIPISAAVR